jgi:hypothetical protein
MDGEKLPNCIIYKGLIPRSRMNGRMWLQERSLANQEGPHYTVQAKAWTDEARMKELVDWIWDPYTKYSRRGGCDTYLIQDEFSVQMMA